MTAYGRIPGLILTLGLALACCRSGGPPAAVAGGAGPTAAPQPADAFVSSTTYPGVARPVRLRIPALRVDTAIVGLGLEPDGAVQVPATTSVAGWFDRGPRPGQPGPAVILGHVDSDRGPGIFFGLRSVRPGSLVEVGRSDGSTVTFRVTKVARVAKTRFPTDLVYAPTLDSTLRLVTCGGTFDPTRGSYRDNVIAYADTA
jgi:sortase (surface protein transpeptidase)